MSYTFSTAEIRASERFDYFREAVAKSYIRSEMSVPHVPSFDAKIDLKSVASLNLSVISLNALHSVIPRPKREMSVPDTVFVKFVVRGCTQIAQDGREVTMRAGDIAILDTARPYVVDIPSEARNFVLEMPRSELEARLGPIESMTGHLFSSRSTEGALALGYLNQLYAAPPVAGADAAVPLARQALDVLALALGHGSSEVVKRLSSPAAVTRLRLHHAIDSSVAEGHVSCEDVANMAGISSRYANLLLAQEGTSLERLIIQRRLERCCQMLADPRLDHRRIGDIALAAGFGSASHFARSFKESFGITAREFRNNSAHHNVEFLNARPNLLQYPA